MDDSQSQKMYNQDERLCVGDPLKEDNEETLVYDTEDGYITSMEDLAAQSIIDELERRPEVKPKHTLPAAPDGGYAWVICCGVFLNHMINEGLSRAEGLFFLQFQSRFDTTAQMAAWPSSLLGTVRLFMGPACGAIVNRYSMRAACIVGTVFCFSGMLLNSFAPNIYFLFLSHTLLGGVGRGLMVGLIILNLYFDKHRSLATGLGMSGIGMGSLWAVPLVQYLFDEYGFSGTCVIVSGLLLHGLLIAMIFRPLRLHYQFMTAKLLKKGLKTKKNEYDMAVLKTTTGSDSKSLHSNIAESEIKLQEKLCTIDENAEQQEKNEQAEGLPLLAEPSAASGDNISSKSSSSSSDDDKDTFIIHESETTQSESNTNKERVVVEQKGDSESCLRSSLKICFPIEFKREDGKRTTTIFHWELMKDIVFLVNCSSGLLYLLSARIAFFFLPAIAISKGLSRQQSALVLTIMGGADTFARIATGFIMDLRPLRRFRPYFFTFVLFLIALDTMMIPFLTSFASFGIVCAIYGLLTGAYVGQKMVFLVDIVGREKLASGLGIQRVFQGVGTLIGPPLAGALRDVFGNYDNSFFFGSGIMFVAALLMTLGVVLLKIRNRKSAI